MKGPHDRTMNDPTTGRGTPGRPSATRIRVPPSTRDGDESRGNWRGDARAEEIEELLVFELFGEGPQAVGGAGITDFHLADPRQQLVQIRPDDGLAHLVDQVP